MDEEKKWMLMTYYCPTHGDSGFVKPIQLTKKEMSETFIKLSKLFVIDIQHEIMFNILIY